MEKEISFTQGLMLTPYGDVSPDGQCSTLENLEVHGTSLRPFRLNGESMQLYGTLVCVHKTHEFIHHIFRKNGVLYYQEVAEPAGNDVADGVIVEEETNKVLVPIALVDLKEIGEYNTIVASGNLLIVYRRDDEPYYLIWEGGMYINLGVVPQLDAEFRMMMEEKTYELENYHAGNCIELYNDTLKKIQEEDGSIFPFFVRAAYRLPGDVYIKHTQPILMLPNTRPMMLPYPGEDNGADYSMKVNIGRLYVDIRNNIPDAWRNLIMGIDIFCTPPIPTYDPDSEFKMYDYNKISLKADEQGLLYLDERENEQWGNYSFKDRKLDEPIENAILIKVLSIEAKPGTYNIPLTENFKTSQASAEQNMPNYSRSHDKIIARNALVYNGRINCYDVVVRKHYRFGNQYNFLQRVDKNKKEYKLYYRMPSGKLIYITDYYYDYMFWWYCNDKDVKSIVIRNEDIDRYSEFQMKPHPFWGGCYYADLFGSKMNFDIFWDNDIVQEEEEVEMCRNTIFTTEVSNPFQFDLYGEIQVGGGRILSLTTNTMPLSEGQMGSFDIIALCTDGNYALSLIKTGKLTGLIESVTPMKPNVCVNEKSVCNSEEGVLMVTTNGLVNLQRNDTEDLDKNLDGVMEPDMRRPNRTLAPDRRHIIIVKKNGIEAIFTTNEGYYFLYGFTEKAGIKYNISLQYGGTFHFHKEIDFKVNDDIVHTGVLETAGGTITFEYIGKENKDISLVKIIPKEYAESIPGRKMEFIISTDDAKYERYDDYDTEGYHLAENMYNYSGYVLPSALFLGRNRNTLPSMDLKKGAEYMLILEFIGGDDLDYTDTNVMPNFDIDLKWGNDVVKDRPMYYGYGLKDRVLVYNWTCTEDKQYEQLEFKPIIIQWLDIWKEYIDKMLPGVGDSAVEFMYDIPADNYKIKMLILQKDDPDGEYDDIPDFPDSPEVPVVQDDVLEHVDIMGFTPRQFMQSCWIVKDVVNNRVLLLRKGCDEGYALNLGTGAWNTFVLEQDVRTVLNTYPYSYIQFRDNSMLTLNEEYKFEDEEVLEGTFVTRPMKMDTLLLKKLMGFCLEGNYSEKQTLTLYGSNDLKHWFRIGSTQRRRVNVMKGRQYKYWRVAVDTKLTEKENITGLRVLYDVNEDGKLR